MGARAYLCPQQLPLSNTSTLTLGEVRLFDQQLAPRGVTLSTVVTALKVRAFRCGPP